MDEDKVLAAIAKMQLSMDAFRGEMVEGFVSADVSMMELRAELRGEIAELRVAVMGKLEQVQDELTAMREDLSVAGFAAMRAVKRTDGDREDMQELNELVNTVLRSVMRLRTEVDELKGRK